MGNFAICLSNTLRFEGKNADDPRDAGGRTSRGITQRVYDAYCDKHGLSRLDVWQTSDATISTIYKLNYWNRIDGDRLPNGLDLCIFDAAVNSGVGETAKWVQRALGIRVDGDFGLITVEAVINAVDQVKLVRDICARRLAMLHALPSWKVYGKGWEGRVTSVQRAAVAMAGSLPDTPKLPLVVAVTPKAHAEDIPKPYDQSAPSTAVTVGSVGTLIASGASCLSGFANDAKDKLQPLIEVWPKLATICAILTVISLCCAVYITIKNRSYLAIKDGKATAEVKE